MLLKLMALTFIWVGLRFILKRRDSLERVLAIGIMVAFVINWLVGTLEWLFRQIQVTLAYFIFAGFLVSLDRVERERLKKDRDKKNRLAMWYQMMTQRRAPAGPDKPVSGSPPRGPTAIGHQRDW